MTDKTNIVTLVLLGRRGSGKSCCGNTILGREGFPSFLSTTPVTTQCKKESRSIQGRRVTVIDTPDFFDDSLRDPKPHIKTCRSLAAEGPCTFLLVLQLGRFTEGEKKIVEQTERVFGPDVTRRMIILFSYGDDLEDVTIEDFLKNAQTELKALVKKCGNRYHVFNNRDTRSDKQVIELLKKVDGVLSNSKIRLINPAEKNPGGGSLKAQRSHSDAPETQHAWGCIMGWAAKRRHRDEDKEETTMCDCVLL